MRYLFLSLILSALALRAQPVTQVLPQPDCQFFFTFTAAGQFLPANGAATSDNRQQGCTSWNMSYVSSGFSAVSVTLQSAANNAGAPSTFGTGFPVQQAIVAGSNPGTNTTGGYLWVQGTNAWVRVTLASATGSGVVNGAVFGWRIPNAASQGGSGGGITCLTGDVDAGSGSGCTSATVVGLKSVPFCTGYSPSSGDFVQYTTGSSPNPCYTSATGGGGSGALTLLEAHAASNSAELDFTSWMSATYDDYLIRFINVIPVTDNVTLQLQYSTNGGMTWDSSAIYDEIEIFGLIGATGPGGVTNGTSVPLAGAMSNNAHYGNVGSYQMTSPGSTSLYKMANGTHIYFNSQAGAMLHHLMSWTYRNTAAVNAFRILCSSGNIASGTVRVYGLSK